MWLLVVVGLVSVALAVVVMLRASRVRWILKAPAEKARLLEQAGQYDEAIRLYEQALGEDPENAELLRGLAICFLRTGRLAEARAAAERAAEQDRSADSLIVLSEILLADARASEGIQDLLAGREPPLSKEQRAALAAGVRLAREALDRSPPAPRAYELLAQAEMLLAQTTASLRHAERAVELRPDSPSARLLLARLLKIAAKPEQALRHCRHAIAQLGVRDREAIQFAARLCILLERHDEAAALLGRLMEQRPGDLALRLELATCYLDRGQPERALREASIATERYQSSDIVNVRAHRLRGIALAQLGRHEEATADLQTATAHAREDWWAHYWLGRSLARLGQRAMARDALLQAAALRPSHMPIHEELARLLVAEGEIEAAVEQLRNGVAARPDDPVRRRQLVDFCLTHGLEDVARRQLEELVRRQPRPTDAVRTLAAFHLERGDSQAALFLARYAQEQDPADAEALHLAARALAALGEHEAAATHFARLVRREPRRPAFYLDWAAMHEAAGDRAAAKAVYARAERALPGHRELRGAVARFTLSAERQDEVRRGLDLLEEELREEPGDLATRLILVNHYLSRDAMDQALAEARKAVEALPDSTAALAVLARVRRLRGEWARFAAVLEEIAARDRREFVVYQLLPTAMAQERYAAAAKVGEASLKRFPEHRRRIELDLAVAQHLAGRGAKGVTTAQRILDRNPRDGDAAFVLSLLLLAERGEPPRQPAGRPASLPPAALTGWSQLVRLHAERPADARHIARLLLKAFVYQGAGWQRIAAQTCGEAVALAPHALLPRVLAAVLWEQAGERARAIALCRDGLDGDDAAPHLRLLLGDLLLLDGQPQDAQAQYAQAARRFPSRGEASDAELKSALLAQALGKGKDALAAWRAAARAHPEDPAAANNTAWALAALPPGGLPASLANEARSAIAGAVVARPDEPAVLDTAGWVHHLLDQHQKAVEELEQAVETAPWSGRARFHLGLAYAAAGKPRQAQEALRWALALAPHRAIADRARRALARLRY